MISAFENDQFKQNFRAFCLTWYMAYLGTILRLRRRLLVFMKTMATGHREVMVRTPMNGLIQMAVPVISSCEKTRCCLSPLPSLVGKSSLEARSPRTYIREVKVAVGP